MKIAMDIERATVYASAGDEDIVIKVYRSGDFVIERYRKKSNLSESDRKGRTLWQDSI